MKGQHFRRRLGFAVAGLRALWRSEASFRTQLRLAGVAAAVLIVVRPGATWVALVLLAAGLGLVAEAANGAIEHLADALHPDHHPLIGIAKDAAAGAALIASLTAVAVGIALACAVTF